MRVTGVKKILVLTLVLTTSVLPSIFRLGGLLAYIVPSIRWTFLAIITLYACDLEKIRLWHNKEIFITAMLVAIFQIFILTNVGLLTGFGRSPYSSTPTGIAVNLTFVSSTLLGTELSRAYLMKNLGRKKPVLTMGSVTLLYSFIATPIVGFLTLNEPFTLTKFLGSRFIPTVTENLLACYLALLAGPSASIAYRGPLQAFKWFSPILPNLSWGYEALIGVMAPTIGFTVVNQYATSKLLRKIGVKTQTRRPQKHMRPENDSMKSWTIISVLCVLIVWASTGLLGFYPTAVATGSMRPTINVGDTAIVIPTDPSKIQVGDIIQYWHEGEMILHRVHDIHETQDSKLFITKGDANTGPDRDPVFPTQIRGKLVFNIPKLGWTSIYAKTAIANVWSYFSLNTTHAYITFGSIALAGLTFSIHAYKNRSHKYWKRKRSWQK